MAEEHDLNPLIQALLRDEGLKLFPYKDTVGKTTIGCGRNLSDRGITREEAFYLLENDIDIAEREAWKAFPWMDLIEPARQDVIVMLVFNMGLTKLRTFKRFLASCEAHAWDDAAGELLSSKYATQVGKRAERLAKQIKTGERQ